MIKPFNYFIEYTGGEKYHLRFMPSVIVKKDGQVIGRVSRFIDKDQLETIIRYYLSWRGDSTWKNMT